MDDFSAQMLTSQEPSVSTSIGVVAWDVPDVSVPPASALTVAPAPLLRYAPTVITDFVAALVATATVAPASPPPAVRVHKRPLMPVPSRLGDLGPSRRGRHRWWWQSSWS